MPGGLFSAFMKSAVRITSGIYRGRALDYPSHCALRPTSGRVRQAVFNILGNRLKGKTFLDCFAGTGINGFEALSRGAARVAWIEENRGSVEAIRANAARIGVDEHRARTLRCRMPGAIRLLGEETFDLVYLDPPFSKNAVPDSLKLFDESIHRIHAERVLAENGRLIVEYFRKKPLSVDPGLYRMQDERGFAGVGIRIYTPVY